MCYLVTWEMSNHTSLEAVHGHNARVIQITLSAKPTHIWQHTFAAREDLRGATGAASRSSSREEGWPWNQPLQTVKLGRRDRCWDMRHELVQIQRRCSSQRANMPYAFTVVV